MEQLTKEELRLLADLVSNAQVRVNDAPMALELKAKLLRMSEDDGSAQDNQKDTPHPD